LSEEIHYPSIEQVSRLYKRIIEATGGESGYLSKSNLGYLLETVKDVGERLPRRQAIVKKAAFLLYNVIAIHPFLNGSKRASHELVKLFLESNGYAMAEDATEAYRFLLAVASGRASESEVEVWVARHLTELPRE
jgi:death-on-curing family protein